VKEKQEIADMKAKQYSAEAYLSPYQKQVKAWEETLGVSAVDLVAVNVTAGLHNELDAVEELPSERGDYNLDSDGLDGSLDGDDGMDGGPSQLNIHTLGATMSPGPLASPAFKQSSSKRREKTRKDGSKRDQGTAKTPRGRELVRDSKRDPSSHSPHAVNRSVSPVPFSSIGAASPTLSTTGTRTPEAAGVRSPTVSVGITPSLPLAKLKPPPSNLRSARSITRADVSNPKPSGRDPTKTTPKPSP
jgi:hypothetical protein